MAAKKGTSLNNGDSSPNLRAIALQESKLPSIIATKLTTPKKTVLKTRTQQQFKLRAGRINSERVSALNHINEAHDDKEGSSMEPTTIGSIQRQKNKFKVIELSI